MDHVLLTRFNLPTVGEESLVRAADGWLTKRWGLFNRYCLPSVENQTVTDFKWLIYLDPESPEWLINEMRRLADRGIAQPTFRTSVSPADLSDDIGRVTNRRTGLLATTNLDNDDAIDPHFLERVQGAAQPGPAAIYLVDGLIKTPSGLYRHTDRVNAFCSVIDQGRDPKNCWLDWHNLLPTHMPAVYLEGAPAWLQVVHGTNVSNRLHGRLVDPRRFDDAFPGMLDDFRSPTPRRLILDGLILGPCRDAVELMRRGLKTILVRTGGKVALERAKLVRGDRKSVV